MAAVDERPSKKQKMDPAVEMSGEASDTFDDTEDLYNEDTAKTVLQDVQFSGDHEEQKLPETSKRTPQPNHLPGLGSLSSDPPSAILPPITNTSSDLISQPPGNANNSPTPTSQPDVRHSTQETVVQHDVDIEKADPPTISEAAEAKDTTLNHSSNTLDKAFDAARQETGISPGNLDFVVDGQLQSTSMDKDPPTEAMNTSVDTKVYNEEGEPAATEAKVEEEEFLLAAEANRGSKEAEWQYDSSDVGSSDSDATDSDSSSSDGSEVNDYELLGPEEQARMLMAEEAGSDDEAGKSKKPGNRTQPRTQNEISETAIEKPNVHVTPEMEILELGVVDAIVETYVLIKGTISAETQVLESGSVLCLPDRTVIGAVAEPIGRVEAPYYSVAYNSVSEIKESGVELGQKIFYLKDHSSYVFTQPLKNLKGSDASNIHDEEVGEDEMEFSDDEAEAEYKRQKKLDRMAKKGILPKYTNNDGDRSAATPRFQGKAEAQYPIGPINYEDEDADGMYQPLSRPSELLNNSIGSPPTNQGSSGHRGRGGKGRGDRGRGNRGHGRANAFGKHKPRDHQPTPHSQQHQHSQPIAKPAGGSIYPPTTPFPSFIPQPPSQNQNWNFTAPNPPVNNPMLSYPPSQFPPGAFINPAFFGNQQQPGFPVPGQYAPPQNSNPQYGQAQYPYPQAYRFQSPQNGPPGSGPNFNPNYGADRR